MALQILNMSVDSIEFHPLDNITASTDLGDFNDINSATEYISEILLGHKNAFPEFSKKPGSKQSQSFKHIDIKKYPSASFTLNHQQFAEVTSFAYPLDEQYSYLFSKEINPPPPKC